MRESMPVRRALLLAAIVVAACGGAEPSASSATAPATTAPARAWLARAEALAFRGDLYGLPDAGSGGAPGDLLRLQRIDADAERATYRMLYRSRSADGLAEVPVSGTLWIPLAPPPDGGYPIVAWAGPIEGPGDACTVSKLAASADMDVSGILFDLVRAGFVVAYTDYEGHGTALPFPMSVGESQAHSLVDAARAARDLLGSAASDRVVMAGHFAGGEAAAAALMFGPAYATGLDIRGVVVGESGRDHVRYIERLWEGTFGPIGLIRGVAGYTAAYPELHAEDILTARGLALVEMARQEGDCAAFNAEFDDLSGDDVLARHPLENAAWAARLGATVAMSSDYPAIFLVAGVDVPDFHLADLQEQVDRLCGAELWFEPEANRDEIMARMATRVIDWMKGRVTAPPGVASCR
jgi:hypothetical protein